MASLYKRNLNYWIKFTDLNKEEVRKNLSFFNEGRNVRDKKYANFMKNKIENELALGQNPVSEKVSANYAKDKYYTYCQKRLEKSTVDIYKVYIDKFFDNTKIKSLNSITERTVNDFLDSRDISNRTANHTIKILKQFLNFCVRQNFIIKNPIDKMKTLRVEVKPPRFLSKQEIKLVLKQAKNTDLYPIIATAIYTGLRLGELKRLQWSDIDLKRKQITVRIAKSKRFRVVPIHNDLMPILSREKGSGDVFDTVNLRARLDSLKETIDIPNFGFHTFRHTFASHLVMNGVDIVTVSKLLGHSSISVTQIYSHLSNDHIKKSIENLSF